MLEQLRSKGYLAIEVYQAQANEINAELAKLKDVRQEKFNSRAATMLEEVKKLDVLKTTKNALRSHQHLLPKDEW